MDTKRFKSLLLSHFNDRLEVTSYGHGYLVSLPWQYSDDDSVSLFIEDMGTDSWRISDQGSTLAHLDLFALNFNSQKIQDAWAKAVASIDQSMAGPAAGEIATVAYKEDEIALKLIEVASACLRAEQTSALLTPKTTRPRFRDRVLKQVGLFAREHDAQVTVQNNYEVELTSGRKRRVTSFLDFQSSHKNVLIQAVGGNTPEQREEQLGRCYHVLDLVGDDSQYQRLVVANGAQEAWDPGMRRELEMVSEDLVFIESQTNTLTRSLSRFLQPA